MEGAFSPQTIAKLKARAADPERRTDMAALAASSIDAEGVFTAQRARIASKSPEHQQKVREYLEGMNTPLAGMISNSVMGDGSQYSSVLRSLRATMRDKPLYASMGGRPVALAGRPEPRVAQRSLGEAVLVWAEGELGFALPPQLRTFFMEVANGEVGPVEGIYPVAQLIAKWREVTEAPAGPQGQAWPEHLLPIAGDRDVFSINRQDGHIVYWDVNELELDDDVPRENPAWLASFKPVAESLDAWLAGWLDSTSGPAATGEDVP